jgi:hypothetical protein
MTGKAKQINQTQHTKLSSDAFYSFEGEVHLAPMGLGEPLILSFSV